MIKEWIRSFYGYYFLKDIINDIRHDIAKLYGEVYTLNNNREVSRLSQIEDAYKKADLTNQDVIRFILRHLDISDDVFQKYKYFEFKKTPWYIKDLFFSKYKIVVKYELNIDCPYLYYKEHLIGGSSYSHMGELLDNIKKVDDELSDK